MEILKAGESRLEFDGEEGTYSIYHRDREVFANAKPAVFLKGKNGVEKTTAQSAWTREDCPPGKIVMKADFSSLKVRFSASDAGRDAILLKISVFNAGEDEPVTLEAITPLLVPPGGIWSGEGAVSNWRFYVNGWQCWSPSGVVKGDRPGDYLFPLYLPKVAKPMVANTSTPVSQERGSFSSDWFGGISDVENDRSVVVGFTGVRKALSRIAVKFKGKAEKSSLEATSFYDGTKLEPGDAIECEPLVIIPGNLSSKNLELYAEMVAMEQGIAKIRHGPSGWCSWYHYFTGITESEVMKNLSIISEELSSFNLELVQVDDGYQRALGDWLETNDDFPSGMKKVAEEILKRGKIPGIWVAPFTVTRKSRIFKEKKEWLLRDEKGKPVLAGINPMWKGRYYGLDVSHPEVLQWLSDLFSQIVQMGYRYIKLDFLAAALLEGKRHNPQITRAEAVRRAIETIRQAVGEDVFIVCAGGGFMLGIGVFDSQRIGGDVAPYWLAIYQPLIRDRSMPSTRNALIYLFTRTFLSGRVFEGDPDCMMLRSKNTKLTDTERKCLASAISIFGGAFIVSDDLSLIEDREKELLAMMVPHVRTRPTSPEVWKEEIPSILVSEFFDPLGKYYCALKVNWDSRPRSFRIDISELGIEPDRYHIHEFWSSRYLGCTSGVFSTGDIPPHGAGVFRLTPHRNDFQVLGTSVHITQGAGELKMVAVEGPKVIIDVYTPIRRWVSLVVSSPGVGDISAQALNENISGLSVEPVQKEIWRLNFVLEGEGRIAFLRS